MIESSGAVRVLHVSEAFGGGLASAVHEYITATPEFEHYLAYVGRTEAPLVPEDLAGFSGVAVLHGSVLARLRQLRRFSRRVRPRVVHAHSAYGGVYARVALSSRKLPVVYTPHCFPFEREDFVVLARAAFRLTERLLAGRTALIIACSPREVALSKVVARRVPVVYVPNVFTGGLQRRSEGGSPTRVIGVGRLTAQKDPAFFAACIRELRAAAVPVDAEWIGDGDEGMRRTLEAAGVSVSGWITREQSRKKFRSDGVVYLHTALWEGFPMSILEAQDAAAPVIVRHNKWHEGLSMPAVIDDPSDVVDRVRAVLSSDGRRNAVEALDRALLENSPVVQRARLLTAYDRALGGVGESTKRTSRLWRAA